MKKTYLLGLGVAAVSIPFSALGATYYYVDTSGEVNDVEAVNANAALEASAYNRAENSGVAIDRGLLEEGMQVRDSVVANTEAADEPMGTGGAAVYTYNYVTVDGTIGSVTAANAQAALEASAYNRLSTSGVIISSEFFGVGGGGDVDNDGLVSYQYVDVSGDVDMIEAVNAEAALALASSMDIHPESGVVFAEVRPISENVEVAVR